MRRLQVELGAASKPFRLSSKADPNEIAAIPEQKASFDDCSSVEAAFDGQSVLRDTRELVTRRHDFRQSVDTEEVDSLAATDGRRPALAAEPGMPDPLAGILAQAEGHAGLVDHVDLAPMGERGTEV